MYEVSVVLNLWTWSAMVGIAFSYAQAGENFLYRSSFFDPSLKSVIYLKISPDGRYLYSSGGTTSVNIFSIVASGALSRRERVQPDEILCDTLESNLSPDGSLYAVTAPQCDTLLLYRRDSVSGGLALVSFLKNKEDVPAGLLGVRRVEFSPDGRFLYASGADGVTVAALDAGVMTVLQVFQHSLIRNTRNVSVGEHAVYVSDSTTGTLFVFRRNSKDGLITLNETHTKGEVDSNGSPVRGLDYLFDITQSADGSLVYTNAGRFGGESVLTTWKVGPDGRVQVRDQIFPKVNGIPEFLAPHFMQFSPKGSDLFMTSFGSSNVLHFKTDTDGSLRYFESLTNLTDTPAGVILDPTGNHLYVASEGAGGIVHFARAP